MRAVLLRATLVIFASAALGVAVFAATGRGQSVRVERPHRVCLL
jgi:hypothetical protein